MSQVLGIDIGGTNMRGALVDDRGNLSNRKNTSSDARSGINELFENLVSFIGSYKQDNPSAIGVGIPGIIDSKNGNITQAPNISGVSDFPLSDLLSDRLPDLPIIIENDANCAALGEFWVGSCVNSNSMAMLTLGTGLGGGLILNGEIWRGENGMAGEIGHMVIDSNGPECNCGNYGCLESFVSAESIRKIVRENPGLVEKTSDVDPERIPERIMQLAINGDEDSLKIWNEFGRYLGIGITNLINLLNVDSIVIGGGLSNSWDLFIGSALKEIEKRSLDGPRRHMKVYRAELGDDAGIIGSAYLAFKHLELL